MSNIAQDKPATANSSMAPYSPSRAVDGVLTYSNRWVSASVPCWLAVDLQTPVWINRWVVSFMGVAGWSVNYNVTDFKLQVSNDNVNWSDADTVTNNSLNKTDRTFPARFARYARVYITKGLRNNNKVASIVELEVYDTPGPSLTSLVPSLGSLNPAFSSGTLNYSMNVDPTVGSITFTPTAMQNIMPIKINGAVIASGQSSQAIALFPGNNAITIEVSSADGIMKTTYSINVVKVVAVSYLSALAVRDSEGNDIELDPAFQQQGLTYSVYINNSIPGIKIKPTAVNASSTIKVDGASIANGTWSALIPVNNGTSIQILVNSTIYTIVVHIV